jgi:hypothetical protein
MSRDQVLRTGDEFAFLSVQRLSDAARPASVQAQISLRVLQINSIEWRTLETGLKKRFRIAAHPLIAQKTGRMEHKKIFPAL